MRYKLRHLPQMMMTPIGRRKLAEGTRYRALAMYQARAAHHRRSVIPDTRLVAVTGSLGKTTTARMVNAALGLAPEQEPGSNFGAPLARQICDMRPDDPVRVLEVGINRPGQMKPMAQMIRPDIAIITSISTEHLTRLKTLETTRHEKAFLLRALKADGVAVLNADDEHVMWMASQTSAQIITWGSDATADLRYSDIRNDFPNGTRFSLHHEGKTHECEIRLLGLPSVLAANAAAAAAVACGEALEDVLPRIEKLVPTPCRLEPITLANGAMLINDSFKNNAECMVAALEYLRQCVSRRRIAVLGEAELEMGDESACYLELTQLAFESCETVYVLGDCLEKYRQAASQLGLPPEKFVEVAYDFPALSARLLAETRPGDIILPKVERHCVERLCLLLQGRTVNCTIPYCWDHVLCQDCEMLERGWGHSNSVEWLT